MDRLAHALGALVIYVWATASDAWRHCEAHHDHADQAFEAVRVETQNYEEMEHVADAAVSELATIQDAAQLTVVRPPPPVIIRPEDPMPENPQQPIISAPPRVVPVVRPPRPVIVGGDTQQPYF